MTQRFAPVSRPVQQIGRIVSESRFSACTPVSAQLKCTALCGGGRGANCYPGRDPRLA
jgi:hypothetical protein